MLRIQKHINGRPVLEVVTAVVFIESVQSLLDLLPLSIYPSRFMRFVLTAFIGFALLFVLLRLFDRCKMHEAVDELGLTRPWKPFLCFVAFVLPIALSVVLVEVFIPEAFSWHRKWGELLIRNFVGPGLFEEGLYRGYVLGHLLKHAQWGWWPATIFSGALFAASHLSNLLYGQNLQSILGVMVGAFTVTFLFSYLYVRMENNLWGCIFCHFLFNAPVFLGGPPSKPTGIGIVVIAAIVGLLLFIGAMRRLYPKGLRVP